MSDEPRMDGTELQKAHWRILALREALTEIAAERVGWQAQTAKNGLDVDDYNRGLPGKSDWLPIKTAPRDGTHILALGVRGAFSPPTTVHWFGPPPLPGLRAGGWYISVQQNEGGKVEPTHWMPLPALPEVP